MTLSHTLRSFLVGKNHIQSRLEYKSAMLRGYMAILSFSVGVAYIIIDYTKGVYGNTPFYVGVIVLAGITVSLNRRHHFQMATVLFLLTINLIIFLFSSADLYRTGTYMFFISISLSAFSLFGFRNIRYAVLFSALSLILFLVSYLGEFTLLRAMDYSETYITINFVTNFLVALITSVLIVYFLININHHSEQDLLRTTEELRKSRERNELVIEAVNAGIYELHQSEKNIFVSPTWKKLLGYAEGDLTDFTLEFLFAILHPDDVQRAQEKMKQHFIDQKPYFQEVRLRTKSSEYVWFMDSGITKFTDNGQPIVTVGSIIDINERKQAEEKVFRQNELLAKANKELDQFVYSVSHDLRAPLSSILGLTNVYALSQLDAERESIVKLISERAGTLDVFIREILAYSRNSRTDLKAQEVNVLTVVTEVITSLSFMQGFDKVKTDIAVSSGLIFMTDRERLKVILSNLIGNAVKYRNINIESYIHIKAAIDQGSLVTTVEDNGIGISNEHHDRIFDMFYQAHETANGSGLGLYIVKEAIQKLKGSISMQSRHGDGSTFTFLIPCSSGNGS